MASSSHTIVVGAGIGSLAAACDLAMRGERVTVIEQNRHSGGTVNVLRDNGFSFDMGDEVLTNPKILNDLFARAGRDAQNYYRLFELDPQPRFWFSDGVVINMFRRPDVFARILDQQLPLEKPGAQYLKFISHFRAAASNNTSLVHRIVQSPHLLRLCEYLVNKSGNDHRSSSPSLPLAVADRIDFGMWYPIGGMREVAKSVERLAAELGVQFIYGCKVDEILRGPGHVAGVRAGGREIAATAVLCNGHVQTGSADANWEKSCSAFYLFLGLKKRYEHLTFLNVFLSAGKEHQMKSMDPAQFPPPDPTIQVVSPCIIDPGQAPFGGDAMRIKVQAPLFKEGMKWDETGGLLKRYRAVVLKKLKRFGMEDIEDRIVTERALTPSGIEKMYNTPGRSDSESSVGTRLGLSGCGSL